MKKLLSIIMSAAITITASGALSAGAVSTVPVLEAEGNMNSDESLLDIYSERVAYLVNQERRAHGVGELTMIPMLNEASAVRAKETVKSFAHVRPDGSAFYTVLTDAGLTSFGAGENIAFGYWTPEEVMEGWMNSEGHRKNILNPAYKYIGVSVVYENGLYYWDQLFLDVNTVYASAVVPLNYGDVNGDGFIDAVDASIVLAEYAAISVGSPSTFKNGQKNLADMNRDGFIDAVDASIILSIYASNSTLK